MERITKKHLIGITLVVSLMVMLSPMMFLQGCSGPADKPYDTNTEVTKGEPAFTELGQYWVVDNAHVLKPETLAHCDSVLNALKEEGIAETVIIIQAGIKDPGDWATKYGRHLELGEKGSAAEGGNRGLVWLIRPDAQQRITVSIGRGLPRFTAQDAYDVAMTANDYINFNNFDKGVKTLAEQTAQKLREIYGR